MADAIRGNVNIDRLRETPTQRGAVNRGDVARAGVAEHQEAVLHDEGPATVLRREELPDGRLRMDMSDGRTLTQAANGVLKEIEPDGTTRISLPNGILIQQGADGSVAGFDPRSGEMLDVKSEQRAQNGQQYFSFQDPSGASWMATSDTLRFEVWNPSGTVHQKVHSTGGMAISTCTVRRDAATGMFHQDSEQIQVRPDGTVFGHGARMKNIELSQGAVRYTAPDGVRLEADLAYAVPFELQGEGKPTAAPAGPPVVPPTLDEPEAARPATSPASTVVAAPAPRVEVPAFLADTEPVSLGANEPAFAAGAGPSVTASAVPTGEAATGASPLPGSTPAQPGAGTPPFPPGGGVPPFQAGVAGPGPGMPSYPPGYGPGQGAQGADGLPPGYYPDLPFAGMPPGGMPPGGMPPGGMPPGGMPPGGMPLGGMPPGGMPLGGMPPGGMPPGGMPLGGMPPGGMPPPGTMPPGSMPPPGATPFQPLWGSGFSPNVAWSAPPFSMGGVPGAPVPADPYAVVTTANGLIRQQQPDGSMFISLPNSVVVAQGGDGVLQAFDPRANQPLPVSTQDVVTPNGGPEKQMTFRDAAGNSYTMYSKSLDFVVTSPDNSVRQVVLPQGNILVMAQTPAVGPDGKPTVQQHMAEIYPNGQVNTFGDRGIMLGQDRVMVQAPGQQPMTLPLAYPIPKTQGMMETLRSVNPSYATAVSGLNPTPSTAPPQAPPTGQPMPGNPWGFPTPPTPGPQAPPQGGASPNPQAPPQAGPVPTPPQGGPGSTPATPPAQPGGEAPASPAPGAPETPPPAMPMPPQDPKELMDAIMNQVREAGLDGASCRELEGLLPKVLNGTATPAEQARADELIQAAVGLKSGAEASAPSPAPTDTAKAAETSAAPVMSAPPEDPKELMDAIMGQVRGAGLDGARCSELEALLPKVLTSTASPAEQARADELIQAAVGLKNADATPAAPVAQAAAPSTPPAEPAQPATGASQVAPQAAPDPGAPRLQLQPEQTAMVQTMMQQVSGSNPSPQLLSELQPLLERIVANVATADDVARADALVQSAMAGATASTPEQAPAQPTAAGPASVPGQPPATPMFGTPHIATGDELLVAAAGHPEYAVASNPPQEYYDSLQRQQQNQASAAVTPPPQAQQSTPPVVASVPPQAQPSVTSTAGTPPPPVGDSSGVGVAQSVGGAGASAEAPPQSAAQAGQARGDAEAGPTGEAKNASGAGAADQGKKAEESAEAEGGKAGQAGDAGAARGPHKPGVWQKIKDFFAGKSDPSSWTAGWNGQYNSWQQPNWTCWNPYPCQMYGPGAYAPYAAMQGMLAANMLATTFATMAFMPSLYYWSPVGAWGMPTMGYPYMW